MVGFENVGFECSGVYYRCGLFERSVVVVVRNTHVVISSSEEELWYDIGVRRWLGCLRSGGYLRVGR